jgi:hypothetical protein
MTRTRRSGSALALFALAALMVSSLAPATTFAAKNKGTTSQDTLKGATATRHGQIASQLRTTAAKQLPPIELQVDSTTDDSQISGLTYTSSSTGAPFKFAWGNRFTVSPEQTPLSLEVVGSVFFTLTDGTGFEQDEPVGIIIGVDAGSSGSPANAEVVFQGQATVQSPDDFNFFQLPEPVIVKQGDVYIFFVDLTTDAEATPLPVVLPENGGVSNNPRSFYRGTSTPPISSPENLGGYSSSTTLPFDGGQLQGNFFVRGYGNLAAAGADVSGGGQTVNAELQGVSNLTAVGSDTVTLSWSVPPAPEGNEVEPNDSAAGAQVVPFNTVINATIDIGDDGTDVGGGNFEDWYCFTLDAASEISVEVIDDGGQDIDIFLYEKDGPFTTAIAQSAGDCGSREAFTAELAAGEYVVGVDAFDNQNCNVSDADYKIRVIGPGGALLTRYNVYCGSGPDFEANADTFIGSVGSTQTSITIPESPIGASYRVAAVYGDEQSTASDSVTGTPCEGGPTGGTLKIKRAGPGTITFKNLVGDLTGATVTINGVGFTKAPKIKANKGQIKQKGPLANGQTVAEACPSGCTIVVMTNAGCSTFTAP